MRPDLSGGPVAAAQVPPLPPSLPALPSLLLAPVALLALLLGTSAASAAPIAAAPRAGLPAGPTASDPAAMRLLERAAQAPSTVPYSGLQFVSAWSADEATSLVVDVVHRPGHGTVVRATGTAQQPGGETFLPAKGADPSVLAGSSALQLLAGNYAVVATGTGTVAGRSADVVEARWSRSGQAAARFWLDSATGLVLRREVYDQQGRTTRASAFVEVTVGQATGTSHLPPSLPDAWSHEVGSSDREQMRARGWHCPDRLAGDLELVDARRGGGPDRPILHLSYTDGLATVSLFEQRGRLDEENLEGYRRSERDGRVVHVRDGVPTRVVWSAGGTVYTVVADAPPATLDRVVDDLPHEPEQKGGWHRVGRGLDRVASWFNPFG